MVTSTEPAPEPAIHSLHQRGPYELNRPTMEYQSRCTESHCGQVMASFTAETAVNFTEQDAKVLDKLGNWRLAAEVREVIKAVRGGS